MAVTVPTAKGGSAPVVAGIVSLSLPNNFQVTVKDTARALQLTYWMVWGVKTSAGAPTAFNSFLSGSTTGDTISSADQFGFNNQQQTFSMTFNGLTLGGTGTPGDHVWVAYFAQTGTPAGTDAVTAAFDLGPCQA